PGAGRGQSGRGDGARPAGPGGLSGAGEAGSRQPVQEGASRARGGALRTGARGPLRGVPGAGGRDDGAGRGGAGGQEPGPGGRPGVGPDAPAAGREDAAEAAGVVSASNCKIRMAKLVKERRLVGSLSNNE